MAANPEIPGAPTKPGKIGPNFPKAQRTGTTVSPARDRGENRAIPATHCESKRKKFTVGY